MFKKIKAVFHLKLILAFLIPFTLQCNTFKDEGLKTEVQTILVRNQMELVKIFQLTQALALDTCVYYKLGASRRTRGYHFLKVFKNNDLTSEVPLKLTNEVLDQLYLLTHRNEFSEYVFARQYFISVRLQHVRDIQRKYVKIIFVKDIERFYQDLGEEIRSNAPKNYIKLSENIFVTTGDDEFFKSPENCPFEDNRLPIRTKTMPLNW